MDTRSINRSSQQLIADSPRFPVRYGVWMCSMENGSPPSRSRKKNGGGGEGASPANPGRSAPLLYDASELSSPRPPVAAKEALNLKGG